MFLNQKVLTPYGPGRVIDIRTNDIVVQPTSWRLAAGQKPTFYMNPKDVTPAFKPDDLVKTVYGKGQIQGVDESRNIYIITLSEWKLATGKSPTLYLNDDSFVLDNLASSKAAEVVKDNYAVNEEALKTIALIKEEAKELYAQKKYDLARVKYTQVMEKLRILGNDIDGLQKAKFLDMCVTSHSNLALCSWNLSGFKDCITYAKNAISLIEALQEKIGDTELWHSFSQLGYTEEKLIDLKVKSLRIKGKAEVQKLEYDEAKESFEAALKISRNLKITKELDDLLLEVVKRRSSEKRKEKARWQKAFSSRDEQEKKPAAKESKASAKTDRNSEDSNNVVSTFSSSYAVPIFGITLGLASIAAFFWWRQRRY